jgi:hypothetical protein
MDDGVLLKLVAHVKPEVGSADITDYLDAVWSAGSPTEALFYGRLFWPTFTVVLECAFLMGTIADSDEAKVSDILRSNGGDRGITERILNRVPLVELFEARASELDNDGFLALASQLAKTWRAALADAFPNETYVVDVANEPGVGVTITFYRQGNKP